MRTCERANVTGGYAEGPELPTCWRTLMKGSPLQTRTSRRILVSATSSQQIPAPLHSSPLIRRCEVSKQRSGAFPRSRSAIKMARIWIRKLQRYMHLWRTASASSDLELMPSALALPHYCRNPVQNGFSTVYRRQGRCAHMMPNRDMNAGGRTSSGTCCCS